MPPRHDGVRVMAVDAAEGHVRSRVEGPSMGQYEGSGELLVGQLLWAEVNGGRRSHVDGVDLHPRVRRHLAGRVSGVDHDANLRRNGTSLTHRGVDVLRDPGSLPEPGHAREPADEGEALRRHRANQLLECKDESSGLAVLVEKANVTRHGYVPQEH